MKNKINIAIIAGQLVVGGAERQLYLWLSNLNRERYNPIVITLHPGHNDYWEQAIERLNIPLFRVRQRNNRLLRFVEILKILRKFRPHIIHGWHLFASVYAGMASKILGIPSIGGVRNTYKTFNVHRFQARLALNTVNAFISNSNNAAQHLRQRINSRKQQVFTVENAIIDQKTERMDTRKYLADTYQLPIDSFWMMSIGRLEPLKRFDLLLNVLSDIIKSNIPVHCLLVGDGPERLKLETLADQTGISNYVTFTGEVPNASAWLAGMDIFAFTSTDEGMPNVIMEAAMAGLPIVTWRLPFYEELLENEKSALLVEPENTTEMADAIVKLMNAADLRNALGQAARAHMLEAFSLQTYVQKMTAVYETILAGKMNDRDTIK